MSITSHTAAPGALASNRAPLLDVTVILMAALGGFVIFEPSPYEFACVAFLALLLVSQVKIRGQVSAYLTAVVILIASALVAASQASGLYDAYFYVVISAFLFLTGIALAFYVANDPPHAVKMIMIGYLVAATYTSALAVGGYFGLIPFSEEFLRFGRAKGAFEDPNVMGPFLVPAVLYLLRPILANGIARHLPNAALMSLMLFAILLSFSRGAWGHTIISVGLFVMLTFVTSAALKDRLKIVVLALLSMCAALFLLSWALTLDTVAELFQERAQLTQSYDTESGGRFDRYLPAMGIILYNPLGHGAGEFGRLFGEDPHNTYIKMFYAFGWFGGIAFLALVASTLWWGFKHCFQKTPWQSLFHVFYSAFVGLMFLALIIDIDRWRHFHLLTGILWGMMAAGYAFSPRKART
ncbi:MAG: O-antigen ligase family protein [Pseudomonadota bacterium]